MIREDVFRKKVSPSEVNNDYIYIPKKFRNSFPSIFPIIVVGVRLRARIDEKGRIYFPVHRIAKPSDTIVISKVPDSGVYVFEVKPF